MNGDLAQERVSEDLYLAALDALVAATNAELIAR